MPRADIRDFAVMGKLYGPRWPDSVESSQWGGVRLYLGGYGYEHQGTSAAFAQAAGDVIDELQQQGRHLGDAAVASEAWCRYKGVLAEQRLNVALDPMAPRSSEYHFASGVRFTTKRSALEVAADVPQNVVSHLRDRLDAGQALEAHQFVKQINGSGDKIASFFLRDIALAYELAPAAERYLVQPVDIWVRRSAALCLNQVALSSNDRIVARSIVEACLEPPVTPERVNAGMWYFGARIARSEYRLRMAVSDRGLFWSMVTAHVDSSRIDVTVFDSGIREYLSAM